MFFHTKLSNSPEYYYMELGLYHSITVSVETMNTLILEQHNHTWNSNAV